MDLFVQMKDNLKGKDRMIVLPEAMDERILTAAVKLAEEGIVRPLLLGKREELIEKAEALHLDASALTVIDPEQYDELEQMVTTFVERRKGKETVESAREKLADYNYFGTMLVYMGKADGLVSGAIHSTGDTVRPALQLIKTKEGVAKTSGAFIMVKGEEHYFFSDCAITIAPTSEDLAENAIVTAETALGFGFEPRVALLSFSTKGSALSPETEKVREATALARKLRPDLKIDGELQFDAAFVPSVAAQKAPDSPLAGKANVFIFPSLEAGNIGYKMTERLGGFEAVGPILQGLNKPVNDLSRGCSVEDVYKLTLITALQA